MRVGIVGLGYVGLPLAAGFVEAGHEVVGVDTDLRTVEALGRGESHVEDVGDEVLRALGDGFRATTRYQDLAKVDAILVAVPTPLTRNREPDLGPLVAVGTSLASVLQQGQLVVLESTTYPGTTRERFVPLLEESGLAAGKDFFAAFSPERIDPGRTDYTLRTTPKIVGGLTDECLRRAVELYELVCDEVVTVSTPEAAELTKLLENVFRSVNIALVNELADPVRPHGHRRVGGRGLRRHQALRLHVLQARPRHGRTLPSGRSLLSGLAGPRVRHADRVRRAGRRGQPADAVFCVDKVTRALNDDSKPVRLRVAGGHVGVSYEPGAGDLRESPCVRIDAAWAIAARSLPPRGLRPLAARITGSSRSGRRTLTARSSSPRTPTSTSSGSCASPAPRWWISRGADPGIEAS